MKERTRYFRNCQAFPVVEYVFPRVQRPNDFKDADDEKADDAEDETRPPS
jgi:hypothetical protein